MKREFIWPTVAFTGMTMATVLGLVALDRTTSEIIMIMGVIVTPTLAAFGASQLGGLREQTTNVERHTNGTMTRLIEMLERQQRIIAASPPAPLIALDDAPYAQRETEVPR